MSDNKSEQPAWSSRNRRNDFKSLKRVARATGLESATSGVTGRHSNRLSYARAFPSHRSAPGSLSRDGGALVPVNEHTVKWCLVYPQSNTAQSRVLIEKTS